MIEAPPPHIGSVVDDDARGDAAFDHRVAEGAGVEVDEALVHDGRSAGEVCTESDTVRVTDANSGRHDVVDHAGELVDAEHGHDAADAQTRANLLETFDGARAEVGPHDVAEQAELAVEVDTVGGATRRCERRWRRR